MESCFLPAINVVALAEKTARGACGGRTVGPAASSSPATGAGASIYLCQFFGGRRFGQLDL